MQSGLPGFDKTYKPLKPIFSNPGINNQSNL